MNNLTLEIVKYILSGFGLLVPLKEGIALNNKQYLTSSTLVFEDDQVSEIYNIHSNLKEDVINITYSNISDNNEDNKSLLVTLSLNNEYFYAIYVDFLNNFYNPLILFKVKNYPWQEANVLIQANCLALVENLKMYSFEFKELDSEQFANFKNCVEYIETHLES